MADQEKKKQGVKFATDVAKPFGEDNYERKPSIGPSASILKIKNESVDPNSTLKDQTQKEVQYITDEEDTTEPFYSQKLAVQDKIFMARVSEMGGRPQDMYGFLLDAIKLKEHHHLQDNTVPQGKYPADYSKRERDTIYVGLKNSVSPLRVTLRLILAISDNPKYNKFNPILKTLKEKVETELFEKCETIATCLQKYTIQRKGNSTETESFFCKMVADFYRYMAEFTPKTEVKMITVCKEKCQKFYQRGLELSTQGYGFKKALHPCNSTRLSIHLHFGNFLHEQMGKSEQAVKLCQQAVDQCMTQIDDIDDDWFQEASHLCDLMKENITYWKSEIKPATTPYPEQK